MSRSPTTNDTLQPRLDYLNEIISHLFIVNAAVSRVIYAAEIAGERAKDLWNTHLCRSLNRQNSHAPFNMLPEEIIKYIFEIGPQEDQKYPGLLGSVCVYWRIITLDTPALWRYIDFRNIQNGSYLRYMELCLSRSKHSTLDIHLFSSGEEGEEGEEMFRDMWDILEPHFHRVERLRVFMNNLDIMNILFPLPSPLPNLRSAYFHTDRTLANISPPINLFSSVDNGIMELHINGRGTMPGINAFGANPKTMKSLRITSREYMADPSQMLSYIEQCAVLETLEIYSRCWKDDIGLPFVNANALRTLVMPYHLLRSILTSVSAPHLQCLSLIGDMYDTYHRSSIFFELFPHLRILELAAREQAYVGEELVELCSRPGLEILSINFTRQRDDRLSAAIQHLAKAWPQDQDQTFKSSQAPRKLLFQMHIHLNRDGLSLVVDAFKELLSCASGLRIEIVDQSQDRPLTRPLWISTLQEDFSDRIYLRWRPAPLKDRLGPVGENKV